MAPVPRPHLLGELMKVATAFSRAWYRTFLDPLDDSLTDSELQFVRTNLPRESFPSLLDICCGPGRHSLPLGAAGYRVVGIDTDEASILRARDQAGSDTEFRVMDMRALDELPDHFDGALNLWHSFGFFDDATNADIVRSTFERLRPGGRAIFDIYNRDHMRRLPAEESGERHGFRFRTLRAWKGNRFRVEIHYEEGGKDCFEWQLYSPDEFGAMCEAAGFTLLSSCAWFTKALPPGPEHARMQFLLERPLGAGRRLG